MKIRLIGLTPLNRTNIYKKYITGLTIMIVKNQLARDLQQLISVGERQWNMTNSQKKKKLTGVMDEKCKIYEMDTRTMQPRIQRRSKNTTSKHKTQDK